ncbi:MAG: hypothetical protein ACRD0F_06360, partial [Acidimicrobiales bacterium]
MRLDDLFLGAPGHERRLRFHDRLTVISGVGVDDRHGLVEVILGTLAGRGTVSHGMVLTDRKGRRALVEAGDDGVIRARFEDGTPTPPPDAVLAMTVYQLFEMLYVSGVELGVERAPQRAEPRELHEARAALAEVTDQLEAAIVARDAADALRIELMAIDRELRRAETSRAKRHYARLTIDLERARAERAAVSAGPG